MLSKVDYKQYITSAEWAKTRNDVFNAAGGVCETCGKPGKHVHHLSYKNLGNEEPEDLILLCGLCHMVEHGLAKKKKRRAKKRTKKKVDPVICYLCNNKIDKDPVELAIPEYRFVGKFHKKCAETAKKIVIKKKQGEQVIVRKKRV